MESTILALERAFFCAEGRRILVLYPVLYVLSRRLPDF